MSTYRDAFLINYSYCFLTYLTPIMTIVLRKMPRRPRETIIAARRVLDGLPSSPPPPPEWQLILI